MNELTIEEAKDYLHIDRNKLDDEIEKQNEIYLMVAENHIEAINKRDSIKHKMDTEWSKIFVDVKSDGKPSDTLAKSIVESDPIYVNLYDEYLEAKKDADTWYAMRDAWEKRASMLKELCGLYISGYFGNFEMKGGKVSEVSYEEAKRRMRNS